MRFQEVDDQVIKLKQLEERLEVGYRRISEASDRGGDVREWETFWIELLRTYETLTDQVMREPRTPTLGGLAALRKRNIMSDESLRLIVGDMIRNEAEDWQANAVLASRHADDLAVAIIDVVRQRSGARPEPEPVGAEVAPHPTRVPDVDYPDDTWIDITVTVPDNPDSVYIELVDKPSVTCVTVEVDRRALFAALAGERE